MSNRPRANKDLIALGDVRVVDEHGEMIGVIPVEQALFMARTRRLDLVEVNPRATPPVCKFLDLAQFQYEAVAARRRRAATTLAQAKFSVGVHGDLDDGRATWQSGVSFAEVQRAILSATLESGTEFRLVVPGRAMIVALSTSGPADREDPGKFTIYDGDTVIKENANRRDVVRWIEKLLA